MKIRRLLFPLVLFMMVAQMSQGQVLIALVFGDKLNSETLKFGVDGGVNFPTLINVNPSKFSTGFNLGFYFDILLKRESQWYIHTGVLIKSPLGASGLNPYHLTNADSTSLNALFANGTVDRKLRYFNVPILVRYKLKNQLFFEIGPMLGLLYEADDVFYASVDNKKDLSFENNIFKQCHIFDAGIEAGIGYQLIKGTGVNFGIRYYQGLVDVMKNNPGKAQLNSSIYLFASIPVGAGEKSKAKNEAKAREKAAKKEQKMKETEQQQQKK